MRILTAICIVLSFFLIDIKETKAQDCSMFVEMVGMAIKQNPSEQGFRVNCSLVRESCGEYIAIMRDRVSLARQGIQLLREEKSCKGYGDIKDVINRYERETRRFEKLVDKYDPQLK